MHFLAHLTQKDPNRLVVDICALLWKDYITLKAEITAAVTLEG